MVQCGDLRPRHAHQVPPIKWEKLLLKLQAAQAAGLDKVITFEFSHFLSPQSCYPQAAGLYNRYREHFGIVGDTGG